MPSNCGYFDEFYGWVACPPPLPPPSATPGEADLVTVEAGDTLGAIAAANGVSLDDLLATNPEISNPNMISIGQEIEIPASGPTIPDPATGLPVSTTNSPPSVISDDGDTMGDDLAGDVVSRTTTPGYEVDDGSTMGDDVGAQVVSRTTTPGYEADEQETVATVPDPATGGPVSTTTNSVYVYSGGNPAPSPVPVQNGGGNGGNVAPPVPIQNGGGNGGNVVPPPIINAPQIFDPASGHSADPSFMLVPDESGGHTVVPRPVPLAAQSDVNEAIREEAALINTFTIRNDVLDPGIDGEDIQNARDALTILDAIAQGDPFGTIARAIREDPQAVARVAIDLARFSDDPNDIVQVIQGVLPPIEFLPNGPSLSEVFDAVSDAGVRIGKAAHTVNRKLGRDLASGLFKEIIEDTIIPADPDEIITS